MSIQLTKKQARELEPISFGYCEIYNLLLPFTPKFYTAWIYGRNEDLVEFEGVRLSSGYRTTGRRLDLDYKIIEKYNKKADKLYHDYSIPYEKRANKVKKLLRDMLIKGGVKF